MATGGQQRLNFFPWKAVEPILAFQVQIGLRAFILEYHRFRRLLGNIALGYAFTLSIQCPALRASAPPVLILLQTLGFLR
jgi:hypothetical protein